MGFLRSGKPIDSVIRERTQIARAFAGFFGDPEEIMERARNEPLKLDQAGVLLPPLKENWRKRKNKKGMRSEGFDYVLVRRCSKTGKFTKGSRNTLGKKKKTGGKFSTAPG